MFGRRRPAHARRPTHTAVVRHAALAAVVVLAGVAAGLGVFGVFSPPAPAPALGVYAGSGNLAGARQFTAMIGGGQPQYAMEFLDGTSWTRLEHPSWFLGQWGCTAGQSRCSGYDMIWGVPMLLNGGGTSLAAEAAGAYDAHFATLARALAAAGQGSSIIRLGWEFNCGCMPWDATDPATFVRAYRHVVDAFRSVPGTDFAFEWNPDYSNVDPSADYPGDAYVSYVGLDVYDGSWSVYRGIGREFAAWRTWAGGLDWLNAFAARHAKPQFLGEWGLGWGTCSTGGAPVRAPGTNVCGGDDPRFIALVHRWAAAHHFFEVTFWDYGTSTVAGCPRSCAAVWHGGAGNPRTAAALASAFVPGA